MSIDSSNKVMRPNFIALDALRFMLALYVVLFHTVSHVTAQTWMGGILSYGYFATSTFFILSGFLLAHVYSADGGDRTLRAVPYWTFLKRRLANVYPLHVLSTALVVAIYVLLPDAAAVDGARQPDLNFVRFNRLDSSTLDQVEHVVEGWEFALVMGLNALLLQAWNPFYLTLNVPVWSISVLLFFYVVFPFLATPLLRTRCPLAVMLVLALISLLPVAVCFHMGWLGMPETGILHRNPIIRLPEFMAGIVLYAVYRRSSEEGRSIPLWVISALLAIFGGSVWAGLWLSDAFPRFTVEGKWVYLFLHNGMLMPAQLALVYVAACIPNKMLVARRLLSTLGATSISIFFLHMPVFALFTRFEPLLVARLQAECSLIRIWCGAPEKGVIYLLYLLTLISVCVLVQRYFVSPIRSLLR